MAELDCHIRVFLHIMLKGNKQREFNVSLQISKESHVVLFTLHCHDIVSNYFHLVVQAMQKSVVL